jgi:hypothetical protein
MLHSLTFGMIGVGRYRFLSLSVGGRRMKVGGDSDKGN